MSNFEDYFNKLDLLNCKSLTGPQQQTIRDILVSLNIMSKDEALSLTNKSLIDYCNILQRQSIQKRKRGQASSSSSSSSSYSSSRAPKKQKTGQAPFVGAPMPVYRTDAVDEKQRYFSQNQPVGGAGAGAGAAAGQSAYQRSQRLLVVAAGAGVGGSSGAGAKPATSSGASSGAGAGASSASAKYGGLDVVPATKLADRNVYCCENQKRGIGKCIVKKMGTQFPQDVCYDSLDDCSAKCDLIPTLPPELRLKTFSYLERPEVLQYLNSSTDTRSPEAKLAIENIEFDQEVVVNIKYIVGDGKIRNSRAIDGPYNIENILFAAESLFNVMRKYPRGAAAAADLMLERALSWYVVSHDDNILVPDIKVADEDPQYSRDKAKVNKLAALIIRGIFENSLPGRYLPGTEPKSNEKVKEDQRVIRPYLSKTSIDFQRIVWQQIFHILESSFCTGVTKLFYSLLSLVRVKELHRYISPFVFMNKVMRPALKYRNFFRAGSVNAQCLDPVIKGIQQMIRFFEDEPMVLFSMMMATYYDDIVPYQNILLGSISPMFLRPLADAADLKINKGIGAIIDQEKKKYTVYLEDDSYSYSVPIPGSSGAMARHIIGIQEYKTQVENFVVTRMLDVLLSPQDFEDFDTMIPEEENEFGDEVYVAGDPVLDQLDSYIRFFRRRQQYA